MENVFGTPIGNTPIEKRNFLLTYHIALWDVIKSCLITGSSDSSIKEVIPNDIEKIVKETKIKKIYTIGKTATNLYQKYIYPTTHIESVYLPSTSSANATMKLEDLVKEYQNKLNRNNEK